MATGGDNEGKDATHKVHRVQVLRTVRLPCAIL